MTATTAINRRATRALTAEEPADFSVVLGGPIYQLFRRARFLVALPLLILAELVVYHRMRRVVGPFFARDLISDSDQLRFNAATASALHLRNSRCPARGHDRRSHLLRRRNAPAIHARDYRWCGCRGCSWCSAHSWCLRASSHGPSVQASGVRRACAALRQRLRREVVTRHKRSGRTAGGHCGHQSLADLGNSFEVIRTMRITPFSKETVFQWGVVTLAPLVPLLLTMISLEELLKRLLSAVF